MKNLKIFAVCSLLSLPSSLLLAEAKELGTIQVEIEGFANEQGHALVSLDNSAEEFDAGPLAQAAYQGKFVAIKAKKVVVLFKDIPYGTYAIKAFHDANKNTELDTNVLGIPNESYGFSNNARGTFGPPKFKDASFVLNEGLKTLKIQLK